MKDVNLVDFVQLTLKSKNDFEAAFDIVLSTKLGDYLKLLLLPQPGDWPAQFYSRQTVYETLLKFTQPVPTRPSSSATTVAMNTLLLFLALMSLQGTSAQ